MTAKPPSPVCGMKAIIVYDRKRVAVFCIQQWDHEGPHLANVTWED